MLGGLDHMAVGGRSYRPKADGTLRRRPTHLIFVAASACSTMGFGCEQSIPAPTTGIEGMDAGPVSFDSGVDASVTVTPSTGVNGPNGTTVKVPIMTSPAVAGLTLTVTALPASIAISPSTLVTTDNGTATAFALVPYGTQGFVVVSGFGTTSGAIPVSSNPIQLTATVEPTAAPGPAGTAFTVDISGAPQGVVLSISALPTTISVDPHTYTVGSGPAAVTAIVPYGVSGVLVASAPGIPPASAMLTNAPLTVACTSWTQLQSGLYQLTARIVEGNQPVPAATATFAPLFGMGSVQPQTAMSDSSGIATTFVTIPDDAGTAIVDTVVGSSEMTTAIGGNAVPAADGGACL